MLLLGLSAAGWWLVIREGRRIPVEQGSLDGLHVTLEQARWILDQMDHGENFSKPSVMMPDMPDWGSQRLTLELALTNRADGPRRFDGAELVLVPERGDEVPPIGAGSPPATLSPGQSLNTAVHFDFDTSQPHGRLRVAWRHGGDTLYLPVPEPAEHYHLRPRGGGITLPTDARLLLPLGKVELGARLFRGTYGCIACHGDPQVAGSNNVGPHLAGVAAAAGGRVEGLPALQYLYESIVAPSAAIAPECKNGPCTAPTAMPEYASLLTVEDAAHLLAYLVSLDRPLAEPAGPAAAEAEAAAAP